MKPRRSVSFSGSHEPRRVSPIPVLGALGRLKLSVLNASAPASATPGERYIT